MALDERLHLFPGQTANARCELGQGHGGDVLLLENGAQLFQSVIDVMRGRLAWMSLFVGRGLLRHQVDDDPLGAGPEPGMSGLRVVLVAVVAKILGHGRMPLAECQGQALVEMIVGGDAVGNGLGITQKDVAANFRDQFGTS